MSKASKAAEWSQRSWHTLDYSAGRGLDRSEVKNLERILSEDPDDGTARLLLAGYYERFIHEKPLREHAAEEYIKHLVWLIDHEPANPDLRYAIVVSGNFGFEKVKTHWHKAIRTNPYTVYVLVNAAQFFQSASFKTAEKLWKRIIVLEPNNEEWHRRFSFLYCLHASDSSSTSRRFARKCIEQFRIALELHAKFPSNSYLRQYLSTEVKRVLELARAFECAADVRFFEEYLGRIQDKKLPNIEDAMRP